MSPEIQSAINDLLERVKRLESTRTKRGRTNQRGAADYLGCSRERLRQLHLLGIGPPRDPDGFYPYDGLDSWTEQKLP